VHDFEREPSELRKPNGPTKKPEPSRDERNLQFASQAGNRAIQRLLDSSGGTKNRTATGGTQNKIDQKRGAGESLTPAVRGRTEDALGQDFSDVRIHRDSEADRLSRSLGAKAFTTGNDIFFKSGAYQPESTEGERLLSHELTHVFQQRSAGSVEAKISDPNDASERQAHDVAESITSGLHADLAGLRGIAPAGIALEEDEEEEVLPPEEATAEATEEEAVEEAPEEEVEE
jgi:hypothetical protein